MKFREKTYLITLLLFLLVLNACIFSLAFYTYKTSVDAAENICYAEERVIAEAVGSELAHLKQGADEQIVLLSYGTFYKEKSVSLAFYRNGELLHSTLHADAVAPQNGFSKTQRIGDKRYFLITQELSDSGITMVYAKDISYLDHDFKTLALLYIPASVLSSALLAFCLFWILQKLASPLEKLHNASGEIASGNFSVRADDSGKDEFALLAKDFNRMASHVEAYTKALEESNTLKQQMLDNLAHEMRTPLTSIRGYAEFLQNANISESETWEATEYIITEAKRLEMIGERLLDEAFIRENGVRKQEISVAELLNEIILPLSSKAVSLGVRIGLDLQPMMLSCDPILLGMLMTNLTDNAIKACRAVSDAAVTVGCKTEADGRAYLFVRDNGVGMTEEQLAHITEPFYRTDKSRSRNEGGTGLGLSLCARIVASHGWNLHFTSQLGKGTEARIEL